MSATVLRSKTLASTQKTYDLVKVQYKAGAVSGLDLTQAEQSVQSQKADVKSRSTNKK